MEFLKRTHLLRKGWKRAALGRMRKHYWLMIIICLVMGVLDIGYSSTISSITTDTAVGSESSEAYSRLVTKRTVTVNGKEITAEDVKDVEKVAEAVLGTDEKAQRDRKIGIVSLEHARGVAAELVNAASNGAIIKTAREALQTITKSARVTTILLVILSFLFIFAVRILIFNVFTVIGKRYFEEARIYDHVPTKRFLYLIRLRKWGSVVKVIFMESLYSALWTLTIVGIFIKGFSYLMVPYITAENPGVTPKEAITLSRRMMDGHKMEAFFLMLSFIPWKILGAVTFGIAGIFFTNPYKEATYSEYYAYLRKLAFDNNIPGAEIMNDRYLYEAADEAVLKSVYSDAVTLIRELETQESTEPVIKQNFLTKWFGIVFRCDEKEKNYERQRAEESRLREFEMILSGKMYPRRLHPLHETENIRVLSSLHYDRNYSITSLILMFFMMCMVGWSWEVSLHLISNGEFVNRGVLHGPWLPIYGSGGILILLVLKLLRKNPAVEFISAIVLCGILEYSTAWYLEMTHNGQKWWDYTGYFLNIHGRVCAEGLLVFGLGGLAFVYILAPFLDNMIRRIPMKIAAAICVVLLACYIGDQTYSKKHPNQGKGITDIAEPAERSTTGNA